MDSVQITARIPRELLTRIDEYATEHRWSRAAAVQALIERGLEQEGEQMAEQDEEVIRAKWVMDGAGTLPEAAAKLRQFADQLDRMHAEGWTLAQPVEDDYGHLVAPGKQG